MSGHSKWAQIKRQKGVTDNKRGQAFTKMAAAISIAVREGGGVGDPAQNFKLRLTVEKARSINMPKENIERAIERGKGGGKGQVLEEAVYEGFAPGGVALLIEVATDNKQRTAPEIKNVLEKNGGVLATPGSVSYQFQTKGLLEVKNDSLDDIFLFAADAGAEDVEEVGETVIIYTKPEELTKIRDILSGKGLTILAAELIRKPTVVVPIVDKPSVEKVLFLIEKLENLDDVQKVYANFEISDTLL